MMDRPEESMQFIVSDKPPLKNSELPAVIKQKQQELQHEKKNKNKKSCKSSKTISFDKKLVQDNIRFLEYIAWGASDNQAADVLFEVEPEQLAAVRDLAKNLKKANKEFVSDFVKNDIEQNYGKRPYKNIVTRGKNGAVRKKKVLIKHPIAPLTSERPKKMSSSTLKRISTLEKFMQDLLSEAVKHPSLKSKARFVRAIIKAGLDLFKSSINPGAPPVATVTPQQQNGQKNGSNRNDERHDTKAEGKQGGRKKTKSKEKEGKRPLKRVRDDDESSEGGKETSWFSDSETIRLPETFENAAKQKKPNNFPDEQDDWFHNSFSESNIVPPAKKARNAESAKHFATSKGSTKTQRTTIKRQPNEDEDDEEELSDYSSSSEASCGSTSEEASSDSERYD